MQHTGSTPGRTPSTALTPHLTLYKRPQGVIQASFRNEILHFHNASLPDPMTTIFRL